MTSLNRFVGELFRAVDALDAQAFAHKFAEDGSFRFGNAPPVVGRRHIAESVAGFFAMFRGIRHEIVGVWSGAWEGGDVASAETLVVYTRHDGTLTAAIPATSTLRMQGGLIEDFRIFADVSPLFAPSHEAIGSEA
jgi:hypothetical protein